MKRALILTATLLVTLLVVGWLAWPRIATALIERTAAKRRQANHLSDDALRALTTDTNLALFSIDPGRSSPAAPDAPRFRGWRVLGQTTVASAAQRGQLAATLQNGLSRWNGRQMTQCFSPRHAIRATDGVNTFELLICFECGWGYYFPPNSTRRQLHIWTKPGPFDDILVAANVPRPKQPKHP